ncbi:MAG: hypothetical protein ACREF3_09790 [Acetobacteraceae bacterium]
MPRCPFRAVSRWFALFVLWLLAAPAIAAQIALPVTPADGLSVSVSVGGGPARLVQVDTGSVGLIVWQGDIGADAVAEGPGEREYNSSGRIFRGTYFRTRVAFQTKNGSVRTALLRVLAVDRQDCDPAKSACRPREGDALRHVGVLGVGFDRPAYTAADRLDQSDNPFLNLETMRQRMMPRRYIISVQTVWLGGTPRVPGGFRILRLSRRARGSAGAPDDWGRPIGCYTLTTDQVRQFGPFCTKLLVDTGLPEMILTLPKPKRPPGLCDPRCPAGMHVTVRAGKALNWSFVTGERGAPDYVRWGLNGTTTQINTGRALLEHHDYLYDATQGIVGFRTTSR